MRDSKKPIDLRLRKAILVGILFLILTMPVIFTGCSGDSGSVGNPEFIPTNPFEQKRDQVLNDYYTDELEAQMLQDASQIISHYNNLNVFTTSQYGRSFLVSNVGIKDVFDARIPGNYEIFKQWAHDHQLIQTEAPNHQFYIYATAAKEFLAQFGYDAVVFYPDEFNPVLTNVNDTWMFVHEVPSATTIQNNGGYSQRYQNRRVEIEGGIKMTPLISDTLWMFYVPQAGATYQPFRLVSNPPKSGTTDPSKSNEYTPPDATEAQIAARQALGIIESGELSDNTNLLVGSWRNESYVQGEYDKGLFFKGSVSGYTWSGYGLYVVPLDSKYWEYPLKHTN